MMGEHQNEPALFAYRVELEQRVRPDNPLRAVAEVIDFSFIREEVRHLYGHNGNVSVDPEIVLKLIFLLFFDDHKSERELMRILPERLDYLWFLGYGLDDPVPDHSVLSKARTRWGPDRFESFFVRTIAAACEAGLVDGSRLYVDSSLVDADASTEKTLSESPEFPGFVQRLKSIYAEQERKLEVSWAGIDPPACDEQDEQSQDVNPENVIELPMEGSAEEQSDASQSKDSEDSKKNKKNTAATTINTTDPDASLNHRPSRGKARPRYKNHRGVDPACGIITTNESTPADVDDAHMLGALIDLAEANTDIKLQSVAGDSHYGTHENFRYLGDRAIEANLNVRTYAGAAAKVRVTEEGEAMFTPEYYRYDAENDCYICPADKQLLAGAYLADRKATPYRSKRSQCECCPLRARCTQAKKAVRVILRHDGQHLLDEAARRANTPGLKRELRKRMSLAEGSFGDGVSNHGMQRARWRRLWRVGIQNYMVAAVQNIKKLVKHQREPSPLAKALEKPAVCEAIALIAASNWLMAPFESLLRTQARRKKHTSARHHRMAQS